MQVEHELHHFEVRSQQIRRISLVSSKSQSFDNLPSLTYPSRLYKQDRWDWASRKMGSEIFGDRIAIISPDAAPAHESHPKTVYVGIPKDLFTSLAKPAQRTKIAEYYGLIHTGSIINKHCWRDLNRGVYVDGDMDASKRIFIYSRKPKYAYEWVGPSAGGGIVKHDAPTNKVFVTLIKKFLENDTDLFGLIVRWNWIKESPDLPGAPFDHKNRYIEHCWSW